MSAFLNHEQYNISCLDLSNSVYFQSESDNQIENND